MARDTTHSRLPSNVRVRHAAHLARQAELRARKRLRRQRAAALVEAAVEAKAALEAAAELDERARLTYRAADRKVEGEGWLVEQLAEDGSVVGLTYEPSRDKARKLARERNEAA